MWGNHSGLRSVLIAVSVVRGLEALDVVKPSLEECANKVGEAVQNVSTGTHCSRWQITYKAIKANASNVFLSEHLLTKLRE
jgi:hypothetical protein